MDKYSHSVILNQSKCLGCTICIKSCPTQAIRVRDGKAIIIDDKCIDCGECIKVCPHNAKGAIADTMEDVKKYQYKVAIIDPTFISQFGGKVTINEILTAVKNMGFDEVREAAYSAEIIGKILNKEIRKEGIKFPAISSACPAILRLIQVRFPELLPNVVRLESPMEVEARLTRKKLREKELRDDDIGIFFISPCPAKITSIKKPIGSKEKKSSINGALAIKDIYSEICKNLKDMKEVENLQTSSKAGINWARTGGESKFLTGVCYINVDGIQSVIRVLEQIERGKLKDVDFFEGTACRGGCVGGALVVENNFIAKQRIYQMSTKSIKENNFSQEEIDEYYNSGLLHITNEYTPRMSPPLDGDISVAIKKAERIEEIFRRLPGLDCGSCGSPSCLALAEDIVKGCAEEVDCIFLLKDQLENLTRKLLDMFKKAPPVVLQENRGEEKKYEGE